MQGERNVWVLFSIEATCFGVYVVQIARFPGVSMIRNKYIG